MSSEEVKAKIAEVNATYGTNFKWKDDWYVENADKSEYWTLHQKKAYWSRVSMGTYYERYKHKALYHGGSMYASGKDAKRGVLEYVVAYNEQFVGAEGRDAAIQFMVSAALTVATGGTSAFIIKAGYSGVKFLARAGTAVALDELLSISGENTLITKLAEEIGGEKAGQAIEIVEWSIKVANAKQNLVKGTFKLKNGDILEGTFDVAKGVFTDLSLPNSLKGKEEKDDSKENEN